MPNIEKYFPSKYLKASDLDNQEPVVVMSAVKPEPVGQTKEMKAVLYFRGKSKGLILNKTNAAMITKIVGSAMTEEWKGHKVRLYATETTFGHEVVDCIRVKPPVDAVAEKPVKKNAKKMAAVVEEALPSDEEIEEIERDVDPDDDDGSIPF